MYVEICLKLPNNSGGYAAFWGMSNKKDLIIENKVELDFLNLLHLKKGEGCGADYGGMTSYQRSCRLRSRYR